MLGTDKYLPRDASYTKANPITIRQRRPRSLMVRHQIPILEIAGSSPVEGDFFIKVLNLILFVNTRAIYISDTKNIPS